jgi:hypothetical protein
MVEALAGSLGAGESVTPFDFMAFCDDPDLQRRAAEHWVTDRTTADVPRRACRR